MDNPGVGPGPARWYRRLAVQLWLWAILPLTLVLVAVSLTGVYRHQAAMRAFVAERDLALARLYGRQIEEALARGLVAADGAGLPAIMGDARVGARGAIYVLDARDRVLFHPDPYLLGLDYGRNPVVAQARQTGAGAADGQTEDGSPSLASFAAVGDTGWLVLVEEPVSEVVGPVFRFSSLLPILVVGVGLLALVLICSSLHTIVRPLQNLAREAAEIRPGEVERLQRNVGGVEEIRQLQRALHDMVERICRYQASMREYIDGITQGQEAERVRLSRELHDGTVQDLIAIGQRLQLAQRALERGEIEAAGDGLRAIRELYQTTLDELRRTIRALRPIYLEELGFVPALEALAREVGSDRSRAEVVVVGEPRRLRPEVELAAFRVVQEALSNALRHAGARRIGVLIRFGERELVVTVEDDGVGFVPPEAPHALTQAGHLGLLSMHERTLLAGGRLDLESQVGLGTRVTAHFPV